jgi:hypothetical protein
MSMRKYVYTAMLFALLAASLIHCTLAENRQPGLTASNKTTTMSKPSSQPPEGDYAELWQRVDSLSREGLYKSALQEVEGLLTRARKDQNPPQVIKGLLYKGRFTAELEEEGFISSVRLLEAERDMAPAAEAAVLNSLLGELYSTYLSNQINTIRGRTPLADGAPRDVLTWSVADFEREATRCYLESVRETALLCGIPVETYRDITAEGMHDTITAPLRSTLYDLLAHRALHFFVDERSYLTEPVYAFQLDQSAAFEPDAAFAQWVFTTRDTQSRKWLALRVFQEVLRVHLGDADPSARVDADLKRLAFAYNNYTGDDKDARHIAALERLLQKHQAHPVAPEVAHVLAGLLRQRGAKAYPEKEKEALRILEEAIRAHPGTYGARYCEELTKEIKHRELQLSLEHVHPSSEHMLVQVSFRNVQEVLLSVFHFDAGEPYLEGEQDPGKWVAWAEGRTPVQQRRWSLPDPGNHLSHTTELSLQPLPPGRYLVVLSTDAVSSADIVSCNIMNVSDLMPVQLQDAFSASIAVVDRRTGKPLPGVSIDFFRQEWSRDAQRYDRILQKTLRTDDQGMCAPDLSKHQQYMTRYRLGSDTLWLGAHYQFDGRGPATGDQYEAFFFTDRAIYRPGQTVYFKAVLVRRDKDGIPHIVPNRKTKATWYDVNNQPKASIDLVSNAFGTVNGAFSAPTDGLTGAMSIRLEGFNSEAALRVEEYKRPRFEVTFEPVDAAVRLNDQVRLSGKAMAYAGSTVDGAAVRYRVLREARFPYWRWSWGFFPPSSPAMEIAQGVVATDAAGRFEIPFEAVPDPRIPAAQNPSFTYRVTADVTDINGETRSGASELTVGYVALDARLQIPESASADQLKSVDIQTLNWAGKPLRTEGVLVWQRLADPGVVYKARRWSPPTHKAIDEAAFRAAFPDFAYDREGDPAGWSDEGPALRLPFNTANSTQADLAAHATQPGHYRVTLETADPFGTSVTWSTVVQVFDPADPRTRFRLPEARIDKASAQPGGDVNLLLGGQPRLLHWFVAEERDGALTTPRWIAAERYEAVPLRIAESDRGNKPMMAFTVYKNRFYHPSNLVVRVPWDNKKLQITYETFRDKLKPGDKEIWRIRIEGPDKDKVAAEMVTALYDASLDQFVGHAWNPIPFLNRNTRARATTDQHTVSGMPIYRREAPYVEMPYRRYRSINWFDFPLYGASFYGRDMYLMAYRTGAAPKVAMARVSSDEGVQYDMANVQLISADAGMPGDNPVEAKGEGQVRTNLKETVFFFPTLRTDSEGRVVLEFTMNEALTRWKLLTFAHTTSLEQALDTREVVTQKELMILANPPRFFRQGDAPEFAAKVSNLTDRPMQGSARLELLDALTLAPVDPVRFGLEPATRAFNVPGGQSAPLHWPLRIPVDYDGALTWRLTAEAGAFTDGEESTLPVVSNRQLVTETLPIALRGGQSGQFVFESLKNSQSPTLRHHRYTLEFSSNPVWYAVQALPYMMEYPHDCSEQVFSRFYANTLAFSVCNRMPNLKRMYDRWRDTPGQPALQSSLQKNPELKSALLEETPWVLDAQDEARQKQNIALLFDLNRMADEQASALRTLRDHQMPEGGWSWFPGGRPNWYITQHIVAGFGHLQHLGAWSDDGQQVSTDMIQDALSYCTREATQQYTALERQVNAGKAKWTDDHLGGLLIHYLYARSFFQPVSDKQDRMHQWLLDQGAAHWLQKGLYEQGLLALSLHRAGRKADADRIAASLSERAIRNPELGMYWPFSRGYYWYQMPVETQALLIEVFHEIANDARSVEEMRIWLLKNKQTNRWESTKATAEAVYALLLGTGTPNTWLDNTQPVSLQLGGKTLKPEAYEPGTGYFKQTWTGAAIKNNWHTIKVDNPNPHIVWGAAYWQYFEDIDKVAGTGQAPMSIRKQLMRETTTPTGPVLSALRDSDPIRPGDRLVVRIELRVDRAMEFVHLKDGRAGGLEPVNVLSGYHYEGGLGYYESTRDLATHFFIDYLPKGTFVLEYPLVASGRGSYASGMASLQCMYAPEFSSHSAGMRIQIE